MLKEAEQQHPRGRSRPPVKRALTTHVADGPNQLWCWDITWLPTTVKGRYFYWYMIKDVYSRKLVANEVHESESAEQAAQWDRVAREHGGARGALAQNAGCKHSSTVSVHSAPGRIQYTV